MNKREFLTHIWEQYDTFYKYAWEIDSFEKFITFWEFIKPRRDIKLWNPLWLSVNEYLNSLKEYSKVIEENPNLIK